MKPAQLFELLRRCTVEHDWTQTPAGVGSLLAEAEAREIGAAAAAHGVTNLVYLSTRDIPELDHELRSLLTTVYHLNLTHHMRVIGEVDAGSDQRRFRLIRFGQTKRHHPVEQRLTDPREHVGE